MMCLMLLALTVASARGKVTRDASLLPTEARELIANHFPGTTISYLKVEKGVFNGNSYEVRLADGTELDFNGRGQWTEVETDRSDVPAGLIPDVVRTYMRQHYGGQHVKKIKHNRRGYELKLGNGLEVEFDNMGNFLRLDD